MVYNLMIVGWYGFERDMNKESERKDWVDM